MYISFHTGLIKGFGSSNIPCDLLGNKRNKNESSLSYLSENNRDTEASLEWGSEPGAEFWVAGSQVLASSLESCVTWGDQLRLPCLGLLRYEIK